MTTIFGTPYTAPTSDELQALVRQAHRERAEAVRAMWSALFRWRRETRAEPPATCAALRPSF
jgi:hypothetical protein